MGKHTCLPPGRRKKTGRTPEDGGRTDLLREGVECERGDDRASLAARGGQAVRGRTETGREDFSGVALSDFMSVSLRARSDQFSNIRRWCYTTKTSAFQRVNGERNPTHVLAPKLKKNWRKAKQTTKAGVLRLWNWPARIPTTKTGQQPHLTSFRSQRAK